VKAADNINLNKSRFSLLDEQKFLLLRSFNITATSSWNNHMEEAEWVNLNNHFRRKE